MSRAIKPVPDVHKRNRPGQFRCPHCDELLSSRPAFYSCPARPHIPTPDPKVKPEHDAP